MAIAGKGFKPNKGVVSGEQLETKTVVGGLVKRMQKELVELLEKREGLDTALAKLKEKEEKMSTKSLEVQKKYAAKIKKLTDALDDTKNKISEKFQKIATAKNRVNFISMSVQDFKKTMLKQTLRVQEGQSKVMFQSIKKHWEASNTIREGVSRIFSPITNILGPLLQDFAPIIDGIKSFFGGLKDVVVGTWKFFGSFKRSKEDKQDLLLDKAMEANEYAKNLGLKVTDLAKELTRIREEVISEIVDPKKREKVFNERMNVLLNDNKKEMENVMQEALKNPKNKIPESSLGVLHRILDELKYIKTGTEGDLENIVKSNKKTTDAVKHNTKELAAIEHRGLRFRLRNMKERAKSFWEKLKDWILTLLPLLPAAFKGLFTMGPIGMIGKGLAALTGLLLGKKVLGGLVPGAITGKQGPKPLPVRDPKTGRMKTGTQPIVPNVGLSTALSAGKRGGVLGAGFSVLSDIISGRPISWSGAAGTGIGSGVGAALGTLGGPLAWATVPLGMMIGGYIGDIAGRGIGDLFTSNELKTTAVKEFKSALDSSEGRGKNPRSSAQGKWQFIDSTWAKYAAEAGVSAHPSEKLNDVSADKVMDVAIKDYARQLKAHGHDVTAISLYMCHFLGIQRTLDNLALGRDSAMHINDPSVFTSNAGHWINKSHSVGSFMDQTADHLRKKGVGNPYAKISIPDKIRAAEHGGYLEDGLTLTHKGEFALRKKSADAIGERNLNALNNITRSDFTRTPSKNFSNAANIIRQTAGDNELSKLNLSATSETPDGKNGNKVTVSAPTQQTSISNTSSNNGGSVYERYNLVDDRTMMMLCTANTF